MNKKWDDPPSPTSTGPSHMAPAKHKGQRDSLVISFTSTGNKVNLNLKSLTHEKILEKNTQKKKPKNIKHPQKKLK